MSTHASTTVTFPQGSLEERGRVLLHTTHDGRPAVVVDTTPFHPVDYAWPDQPSDVGTLIIGGATCTVVEAVLGAAESSGGPLVVDDDIEVSRGEAGWDWYVVHLLADPVDDLTGAEVLLSVDVDRRLGLSAGHTACELAGLALNEGLAQRWRKQVPTDSRGHGDFDKLAITASRIRCHGSDDAYRLGRSLRRRGFVVDRLVDELESLEREVSNILDEWIAADVPVRVVTDGDAIGSRRYFSSDLPGGRATAPCGGTHVSSTGRLGTLELTLELDEDGVELVMRTRCVV